MMHNCTVFWQSNERACQLFYALLARAERGEYDDGFLAALAAYRKESPDAENADIFAARYLLHHDDTAAALVCAERAYRRRPVHYEIWTLLAEIYTCLGRTLDALTMYGYAYGLHFAPDIPIELTVRGGTEGLNRLSVAAGFGTGAPMTQSRAALDEGGGLRFDLDAFVGEHLPLTPPAGSVRHWVGTYVENAFLSDKSALIEEVRHTGVFVDKMQRDFPFQLQKAQTVCGAATIEIPQGTEVILPIAGTKNLQELTVKTETLPPQRHISENGRSVISGSRRRHISKRRTIPHMLLACQFVSVTVPCGIDSC